MSDANGASTVNAYRFRNKVAVVTGGSSGMGREAAIMLCRGTPHLCNSSAVSPPQELIVILGPGSEGATVVIADLREEALRNA